MQDVIEQVSISKNGVAKSAIAIEMETREKEVALLEKRVLGFKMPTFNPSEDKLIESKNIKDVLLGYKEELGYVFGVDTLKTIVDEEFADDLRTVIRNVFTKAGIIKNKIATNFISLMARKNEKQYCIYRKDCYPTVPLGNRVVYPLYKVDTRQKKIWQPLDYTSRIPVEEAHRKACEGYHNAIRLLGQSYSKFWRTRKPKDVSSEANKEYESILNDESLTDEAKVMRLRSVINNKV